MIEQHYFCMSIVNSYSLYLYTFLQTLYVNIYIQHVHIYLIWQTEISLQAGCCSQFSSNISPLKASHGLYAAVPLALHSNFSLQTPPQHGTGCIVQISEDFSCAGCSKLTASIMIWQTAITSCRPWICFTNGPNTQILTDRKHSPVLQCGSHNPLVALWLTASSTATNKQPFEIHYPLIVEPSLQSF